MMNSCLINIGNTHTEVCDLSFENHQKFLTDNFQKNSASLLEGYDLAYVASVVPSVYTSIESSCTDISLHLLKAEDLKEIDFSKVDSSTIGGDRLANLLAARNFFGQSFLVIDCGTCITAELVVDGSFLGGFIMPGRQLQRNALKSFTGQLPEISLYSQLLEIGTNTEDSIRVGVDTLPVFSVLKWCEELIVDYPEIKICFTGGDYEIFSQKAVFEFSINKELSLQGLKLFAESHKR